MTKVQDESGRRTAGERGARPLGELSRCIGSPRAPTVQLASLDDVRAAVRAELRDELLALGAISPAKEWLTRDEVAELLGVSARSIPTMVKRDGLPADDFGGVRRYNRARVHAWASAQATSSRKHTRKHGARVLRLERGGVGA